MRILFAPLVMARIKALVARAEGEVQWFGTATAVDNDIVVQNIVVPAAQVVSGASVHDRGCRFEALGMFPEAEKPTVRYWGHSHGKLGVFWSSTDTDTMERAVTPLLDGPSPLRWGVATVHNKTGEVRGAISAHIPEFGYLWQDNVPVTVMTDSEAAQWADSVMLRVEKYNDSKEAKAFLCQAQGVKDQRSSYAHVLAEDDDDDGFVARYYRAHFGPR